MPSTGVNEGKVSALYDNSTLVAYATGSEFSLEMDTREITTKDSGAAKEFRPVRYSATGSGEFLFAEDAAYGFSDLYAKFIAGTAFTLKYSSGVTGDNEYSFSAYLTSLSRSSPDGDNETFSASWTGSGTVTEATI